MSAVDQETFRLLLENHERAVLRAQYYPENRQLVGDLCISAKSLVTEYSKLMKSAEDKGDNCSFVGVLPQTALQCEEKENLMAVRDQYVLFYLSQVGIHDDTTITRFRISDAFDFADDAMTARAGGCFE